MSQHTLFYKQGNKIVTGLRCTQCELAANPQLKTNCMRGTGNTRNPTYMFVGLAPGNEDDGIGRPQTGANGRQLMQLLSEAGIDTRDCYFTNCLKCSLFGENSKEAHWKGCKHHFLKELGEIKPTVVVAVGAQAISWLTGHSGVTKLRRKLLPLADDFSQYVYPIRQPAALFHQQGSDLIALRSSMVSDLRYLKDLVDRRQITRDNDVSLDYRIAFTHADVDAFFDEMESYKELAFDLETTSLGHPQKHDRMVSCGFSFGEGVARVMPVRARGMASLWWWEDDYVNDHLIPRLRDFFTRKKVYGHNAIQFDLKWTRHELGIPRLNIDYDTMLNHYLIEEDQGTHKLERLAVLYTNMTPWKSEFTLDDTLQLCKYQCKDCDATYRLRRALEHKITPRQQWLLKELLVPLSHELFDIEWEGMEVSSDNLDKLSSYLQSRLVDEYKNFRTLDAVRSFEISRNCSFDVDKHEDVRVLLRDYLKLEKIKETGGGEYSTDKDVLKHFEHVPAVQGISMIRGLNKLKGTYCEGFRERMITSRIHTSYKPVGTVTGRLASADPNLQNLPREDTVGKVLEDAGVIKSLFIPKDGYVLLQADYSQAELRTLGSVSHDQALIDIYLQGLDAHTATAAKVCGVPISEVTKAQRNSAKAVNFGIVYGMSWESLLLKFLQAGNTEAQARAFYEAHKRMFARVWSWLDEQERIIRRYGQQTTYFGRSCLPPIWAGAIGL